MAAQAAAMQAAAEEQARAALAAEPSIGPTLEPAENDVQIVQGPTVETLAKTSLPEQDAAVAVVQEPPPGALGQMPEELPPTSVAVLLPTVENN